MLRANGRHANSNGCGDADNCVLANGAFTVNGSAFEGTQAATAFVAASIARALSHAHYTIGAVNELFDAAKADVGGVFVFHPFRLIDKAQELSGREDLLVSSTTLGKKFDEAFSPDVTRPIDICFIDLRFSSVANRSAHYDLVDLSIRSVLSEQQEMPCGRDLTQKHGGFFGDNIPWSNKIPVGSIVSISLGPAFSNDNIIDPPFSNLRGYKIFYAVGNGGANDTFYLSPIGDRKTADTLSHFVYSSGDVFFITWFNRSNPSQYHSLSSRCGILPYCVAARSEYYVTIQRGEDDVTFELFPGTSASTPYVASAITRAMLNSPPDTPLDHVNDFFHKASEWNHGIKVFNALKLIDLVAELWKRPRLTSDVAQVASAYDEAFDDTHAPSPRSVTACAVGGDASTQGILSGIGGTHVDVLCTRTASNTAGIRTAFTSDDTSVGLPQGSIVALASTSAFSAGGLMATDLDGYKVFVPTGNTGGVADFLTDSSLYDSSSVTRIQGALAEGNLFYVARLNDTGTGLHASSNGCGDEVHCVAARGTFTVNDVDVEGTQSATAYVAAAMARAFAHAPAGTPLGYINDLFRQATMRHGENVTEDKYDRGIQVFNPFRLIDEVRKLRDRPLTMSDPNQIARAFDETFIRRANASPRDTTLCFIGGTETMRALASLITESLGEEHVTICHRDVTTPTAWKTAVTDTQPTGIGAGSILVLAGTNGFADNGLVRADLSGYKVFAPTGGNGVADFLSDSTLYDAQTVTRMRDALAGGNLFYVARLNDDGTGLHATSNGCGNTDNCVAARGSFTVNGAALSGTQAAATYVAASIARAIAHLPAGSGADYANTLFDKAKMDYNGMAVFNPFRLMDAARIIANPTLISQNSPEEDFESASAATASAASAPPSASADKPVTTTTQKEKSPDDIYQALMRAQYAAVGRAGVPTQMDDVRVDVTELGETRVFTMPATSYRYRALPTPNHSPLFGMLGMVYREDARYPEVGIAFNDRAGRTFMSASHYRSEDFFGAYGSGAFRFNHVDNYRVVGKHEVVAGLDVTLWGRCGRCA